ncbi:MAG TPA: LOG family protein [Xanthobacteraceae bacterium]
MPENDLQKRSPTYRLPASDLDFLLGDSMQGVRFMLEFAKAEERLRLWGIRSTIVVLGSARIRERRAGAGDGAAASAPEMAHWYDESRRFGRIVSERGGALAPADGERENVIATGGGPGIMEAANRGASDVGAPSIGFNIELPREQEPNPYSTPELTFQFHSFTMRKMHLALRAAAAVAFPGGFGTLAELFEVLTLVQTRKGRIIPIVCVDRRYWTQVINFDALLEAGVIAPADMQLLRFADDAEEAWQALTAAGVTAGDAGAQQGRAIIVGGAGISLSPGSHPPAAPGIELSALSSATK